QRRSLVVSSVLEIVEEIAERSTIAAVECFKASPLALRAASLGQFRDWARRGLERTSENSRRIQAYYSLESKASQEALFKIDGGLTLDSIAHTLRLYVEGLTGRALQIASLASIPDEAKIGDGTTIFLPSVVAEFEDERENFRLFKVLAAHGAGQIEFLTFGKDQPEVAAAMDAVRTAFRGDRSTANVSRESDAKQITVGADFLRVLAEFPNPNLATRLCTTMENGRIEFMLRTVYRGIRRDLDFVRSRLNERRPKLEDLPPEILPFELLFQVAICGGPTPEARQSYPTVVKELDRILAEYVFREDATVADSLIATRYVYEFFVEQPSQSDAQSEASGETGEGGENNSGESSLADAEQSERRQQLEVKDDPFSSWSGQQQDISPEQDIFNRLHGPESPEQDLEKGDRAYYYDEWDRELADYRTRWCRVIKRAGPRGSQGFVELVRSRYAGVISSIRYQFRLTRPENLLRIRGEFE